MKMLKFKQKLKELQQTLLAIKSGHKLKDKFILSISTLAFLLLYPINKLLFKLGITRSYAVSDFYFTNVIIKNSDGIFFCRKKSTDLNIIRNTFEEKLKEHFRLTNGNFIDIGAHIGKYTVRIAKGLKTGKVIAIEAHPANFSILQKNIMLNKLKNVIPLNIACWDKDTTVKLYESTSYAKHFIGNVSDKKHVLIQAKKLDDILKNLDMQTVELIKIDVEGAEGHVLRGAQTTLATNKHLKILFETWNPQKLKECAKVLTRHGYIIEKTRENDYYIALRKTI